MRIHHLSCGTMCPYGRRLMNGEGGLFEPSNIVCHCLAIETSAGLVLVDTGLGTQDVKDPRRLSRPMRLLMRPRLDMVDTALVQLRSLGFSRDDVRHIVLTHLDFDHAGGLRDFPEARVHVLEAEHAAAMKRHVRQGHARYRPKQWRHHPRWALYEGHGGEPWFGFQAVRDLDGLPPEILLIPLAGHTPGHAGVAVQTSDGWLLHAGDAYFFHSEVNPRHPWCPPGLVAYQTMMETDRGLRLENQRRLRDLARAYPDDVTLFCAHDPADLRAMQARYRPERRPPRPFLVEQPGQPDQPRPSL